MRTTRRLPLPFLLPVALFAAAACDDDDGGDDSAETGGQADHGDPTDNGGHDASGDSGDPDTAVDWVDMPAAMVASGEAVAATFSVTTEGELHVAELRACMGADVADCGLGEMGSFESAAGADQGDGTYTASLTLAAGTWTVVAYSHVGPDPHVSDHVNVTVE